MRRVIKIFYGIKKVGTASVYDALCSAKNGLILCHVIAHRYVCQLDSDLEN